uniref:Diadenylate cyclase spyDAC Bacterial checkpoint controller DisA with nucleotide-binding domain n=1 Tax=feces metagenome TaxID=1861841 RepID=A0A2I2K939_9ZZZZ
MLLQFFGFLNLSFTDILDILLLAIIIFVAFKWIKGTSAMSIFIAIILLYIIRVLVSSFNMRLMNAMMETILDVGVLALIVIFQPEIRKFLIRLGNNMKNKHGRRIFNLILGHNTAGRDESEAVNEITDACSRMGEEKTGALIIITHNIPLDDIISTGDNIDASIHRRLIMNLFFKNSPLHDGAMIINSSRIVAARCTLPITSKTDIPANFGMRHKAAIGITEESDADAIVVSEETGSISFVRGGKVTKINNINELRLLLNESLTM